MITLSATPRSETGKAARALLSAGQMPAIVYGPKQEATPVSVPLADFEAILRREGTSSVIELSGLDKPLQVLVQELDRDPVMNTPRHADFYAIEKGAKVTVSVPLSFVGESFAVKAGANLVKVMHEVEIEADAANLPHEIEVDISTLKEVGDQIHVKNLKAPKGVEILSEADETVAIAQAVEEETEEESGSVDMSSIEVEQKGKEEAEEGAE